MEPVRDRPSKCITLDRFPSCRELAVPRRAKVRIMLEAAGERRCQAFDRIGVELGISRIAMPFGIGPAVCRDARETLRADRRFAAGEAAEAGGSGINAALGGTIDSGRREGRPKQRSCCVGECIAWPDLELLVAIFGAGETLPNPPR